MQDMNTHAMMGYDRTSTMFAPDGRLLQVEYAKEGVRQSPTAIGMVCKDGVLLVADKRIMNKLIVSQSVEKIYKIDEHMGATAVGNVMDGRVLIEKAQVKAQQHRITYGVPMDLVCLVKEIANLKQFYTQYGGVRPFGVSILYIGIDNDEPKLIASEPAGTYFGFKATAVGESENEIKSILLKEFKETMSIDEGIKLSMKILKKVLGKDFDSSRVDGAYIKKDTKKFVKVDKKQFKV